MCCVNITHELRVPAVRALTVLLLQASHQIPRRLLKLAIGQLQDALEGTRDEAAILKASSNLALVFIAVRRGPSALPALPSPPERACPAA